MNCCNCNKELRKDDIYCKYCGQEKIIERPFSPSEYYRQTGIRIDLKDESLKELDIQWERYNNQQERIKNNQVIYKSKECMGVNNSSNNYNDINYIYYEKAHEIIDNKYKKFACNITIILLIVLWIFGFIVGVNGYFVASSKYLTISIIISIILILYMKNKLNLLKFILIIPILLQTCQVYKKIITLAGISYGIEDKGFISELDFLLIFVYKLTILLSILSALILLILIIIISIKVKVKGSIENTLQNKML